MLEPLSVGKIIKKISDKESPDLIIMKQVPMTIVTKLGQIVATGGPSTSHICLRGS